MSPNQRHRRYTGANTNEAVASVTSGTHAENRLKGGLLPYTDLEPQEKFFSTFSANIKAEGQRNQKGEQFR